MIRLPKSTLFSILVIVLFMLGLNLWLERNVPLEQSDTSFGVDLPGYKAAFDLLTELKVPVTRSYFRAQRQPHERAIWFVLPDFLHGEPEATKTDIKDLLRWVRDGGTAVVLGGPGSDWKRLDLKYALSAGDESSTVQGAFSPTARKIPVSGLIHFDKNPDTGKVQLKVGEKPFAIENKIGSGRLVAVADGRFMLNPNLDQGDSSVLLVDLVRALGTPVFDEHCHGMAADVSSLALFGHPRLLTVMAFALIAALLWIAEQRTWPPRSLKDQDDAPAPSIAAFVDSLGILYARANDPRAAFDAYRSSFLRRARRQFSTRVDMPEDMVIDRITRDRSLSPESSGWLWGSKEPATESELIQAVRALESCAILKHEQRRA